MNIPVADRFWRNVNKHSGVFAIVKGKKSECWFWKPCSETLSYGNFTIGYDQFGSPVFSYMMKHKLKRKPKKLVLHHCDNKPCVRPSHLWKGTYKDNSNDKVSKGRQPKGETYWNAKLKKEQVLKIRKLYSTGRYTLQQLAEKYCVGFSNVSHIVNFRNWKHL